MLGSKITIRQQRIRQIHQMLRAADRQAKEHGEHVLYRETVENLAANLGRTTRTITDYLANLAINGHIRIDATENVILLKKEEKTPEIPETPKEEES